MNTKKLIMFLVTISLMCTISFALVDRGHIGSDWGKGSSPFLNVGYNEDFNTDIITGGGKAEQYPTVCDLDGDGSKELITFVGQVVQIYKLESSGIELAETINHGEDIYTLACVVDPYDPDLDLKHIVVFGEFNVVGYNFDGVNLIEAETYYTYPTTISSIVSQPHCTEFYDGALEINDFICAMGDESQIYVVTSGLTETSFNVTTGHTARFNVFYDYRNDKLYSGTTTKMYMNDVYNLSDYASLARQTLYTSVTNFLSQNSMTSYNDLFSGEIVCQSFYDNAVGVGLGSGQVYIKCYTDGSESFTYTTSDGGSTSATSKTSPIIFYDGDIDGDVDICVETVPSNTGVSSFRCFDLTGTLSVETNSTNTFLNWSTTIGNFENIDVPRIMTSDNGINYHLMNINNGSDYIPLNVTLGYNYLFIDLDVDGFQEVIGEKEGSLIVLSQARTFTDTIIVDDGQLYSGLYGFFNPTCENTQVLIRAKECLSGFNDCTYDVTNTDPYVRERLCTTCAGTVSEKCGDWSYSNPSVTCNFSTSGTKNIQVDLYTDTNPLLTAYEFDSFELEVDNANCDEAPDLVIPVDPAIGGTNETNETIGSTPEDENKANLFVENIWVLMGLFFTIVVVAGMASMGIRHPLILGIVFIGCTVFFGIIGWYDIKFIILTIVALVAIAIIGSLFKSGGND